MEDENIPRGERLILQKTLLSPRQRKLCELAAAGISNNQIAEATGYDVSRVSILLGDAQIQAEIDRLREKIFEQTVSKQIKELIRPSMEVIEECITDQNRKFKNSERLDTAKFIIEKADGKAIQKHDIGENMLSLMLDQLDSLKTAGKNLSDVVDVTPIDVKNPEERLIESVPQRTKSEQDLLNDWAVSYANEKRTGN